MSEYGMNDYCGARAKQERLYELYNQWFNVVYSSNKGIGKAAQFGLFKSIFKDNPRILKTGCNFDSLCDIKKMLYKELRRTTVRKNMAWHRYQDNIRFNLFCISAYRKTHVDVSFARHIILEYLHGRVLKPST